MQKLRDFIGRLARSALNTIANILNHLQHSGCLFANITSVQASVLNHPEITIHHRNTKNCLYAYKDEL